MSGVINVCLQIRPHHNSIIIIGILPLWPNIYVSQINMKEENKDGFTCIPRNYKLNTK